MKALVYPYTLDSSGAPLSTSNSGKIYLDRLLTLLSTNVGQRPMRQGYGLDLKAALFENEYIRNGGERTTYKEAVDQAIRKAVNTWMPQVEVSTLDVGNPNEDGISTISLVILIPGGLAVNLNTTTAIFGSDGTVTVTQ